MESDSSSVARRARLLREAEVPPQLVVKFREESPPSVQESLAILTEATDPVFSGLAGAGPLCPPARALSSVPIERTQEMMTQARARAALDGRQLPDLLTFYVRQIPDIRSFTVSEAESATAQILTAVENLRAHPLVETAYLESPASSPPSVRFMDDTDVLKQSYLAPSPIGVGSILLWRLKKEGCAGEGVTFVDVEQGWYVDHEDLRLPRLDPIFGFSKRMSMHGTSVLGIINAVDNDKGIVGIAPRAKAYLSSEYYRRVIPARRHTPNPRPSDATILEIHSRSDALWAGVAFLTRNGARGHVLVVESQVTIVEGSGSRSTDVLLPVEAEYLNWAVIVNATYCGVVVVEAAGNGDRAINTAGVASLPAGTFDFLAANAHSGAIIVGAGRALPGLSDASRIATPLGPSHDARYARYPDSNYGSRVDCFASGEHLYTLAHSPGEYDYALNLTSAATAVIAGVAIVTQSMAQVRRGVMLEPADLRGIVRETAGALARAGSGIGSMPDLARIYGTI